jgi:SAM-dependent methyltransferase
LDSSGEFSRCVRCGANRRYEILAKTVQNEFKNLKNKDILELDPDSPLRPMLSNGKTYRRSFYSELESRGSVRADGAECQDITSLTLPDQSVDLLVSSEVLEHVADIRIATQEISRILRPGGSHIFTVPTLPNSSTICRAIIEAGTIKHLVEPEYHGDPLSTGEGILAFWTFGRDAAKLFSNSVLQTNIISEDWLHGESGYRAVWKSVRL